MAARKKPLRSAKQLEKRRPAKGTPYLLVEVLAELSRFAHRECRSAATEQLNDAFVEC